jgi:hypothetical protein
MGFQMWSCICVVSGFMSKKNSIIILIFHVCIIYKYHLYFNLVLHDVGQKFSNSIFAIMFTSSQNTWTSSIHQPIVELIKNL